MFFTVPIKAAPKVKIKFFDLRLTAILMDDKNSFAKELKEIINIELDAEL